MPKVYKRFVQEYRNLLNQLQLWYIRADFDVAFSTLVNKSTLFKDQLAPVAKTSLTEVPPELQPESSEDQVSKYISLEEMVY